jgi:hypothetical protein
VTGFQNPVTGFQNPTELHERQNKQDGGGGRYNNNRTSQQKKEEEEEKEKKYLLVEELVELLGVDYLPAGEQAVEVLVELRHLHGDLVAVQVVLFFEQERAVGVCVCVVWCGVMWCGVMWCGVMWCGVVRCDVVWCDVGWCGVALWVHSRSSKNGLERR